MTRVVDSRSDADLSGRSEPEAAVFLMVMVVMIGGVSQRENSRNLFEACSQCLSHFVERYTTPLFRENVSTEDEDCIRKVDEAGLVVTKAFQEKYERGALNDTEKRSLKNLYVIHKHTPDEGTFSCPTCLKVFNNRIKHLLLRVRPSRHHINPQFFKATA